MISCPIVYLELLLSSNLMTISKNNILSSIHHNYDDRKFWFKYDYSNFKIDIVISVRMAKI